MPLKRASLRLFKMPYNILIRSAMHISNISEQKLPVIIGLFSKPHGKAHVLGCSKPAVMVSRVLKSNMVIWPFFSMKSVIFKKG